MLCSLDLHLLSDFFPSLTEMVNDPCAEINVLSITYMQKCIFIGLPKCLEGVCSTLPSFQSDEISLMLLCNLQIKTNNCVNTTCVISIYMNEVMVVD